MLQFNNNEAAEENRNALFFFCFLTLVFKTFLNVSTYTLSLHVLLCSRQQFSVANERNVGDCSFELQFFSSRSRVLGLSAAKLARVQSCEVFSFLIRSSSLQREIGGTVVL
jgi:hypothetical protein